MLCWRNKYKRNLKQKNFLNSCFFRPRPKLNNFVSEWNPNPLFARSTANSSIRIGSRTSALSSGPTISREDSGFLATAWPTPSRSASPSPCSRTRPELESCPIAASKKSSSTRSRRPSPASRRVSATSSASRSSTQPGFGPGTSERRWRREFRWSWRRLELWQLINCEQRLWLLIYMKK